MFWCITEKLKDPGNEGGINYLGTISVDDHYSCITAAVIPCEPAAFYVPHAIIIYLVGGAL